MPPLLPKLIALLMLVALTGCCNLADCDERFAYVQLRLMRDGHNILYGSQAIVSQNEFRHFTLLSGAESEEYIDFIDTFETIGIGIDESFPSILEIEGVSSDTFSVTIVK